MRRGADRGSRSTGHDDPVIRWPVRHPVIALVVWAVLIGVIAVGSSALGGKFNDSFALPGVQSTTAQDLLTELAGDASSNASVTVVWSPADG